jgi:hypothetical protein
MAELPENILIELVPFRKATFGNEGNRRWKDNSEKQKINKSMNWHILRRDVIPFKMCQIHPTSKATQIDKQSPRRLFCPRWQAIGAPARPPPQCGAPSAIQPGKG